MFDAIGTADFLAGGGGSTPSPFNNAVEAYSPARRLIDSYTGPLIRVQRSSDNAQLDIPQLNRELDLTALTNFVGSNTGYVVTMYGQKAGYNVVSNGTLASTPIIINAGTLVTLNGKPAIDYLLNRGLRNTSNVFGATTDKLAVLRSTTSVFSQFHSVADSISSSTRTGGLASSNNARMNADQYPSALYKNLANLTSSMTSATQLTPITTPFVLRLTNTAGRTLTGLSIGNYDSNTFGGACIQGDTILAPAFIDDAATQTVMTYYGIT